MADTALTFPVVTETAEHARLRVEVRSFLAETLPPDFRPGLGMAGGWSPEFSSRLAKRGWVGMSIPRRYGGAEMDTVTRVVVTEELLAAGAPVAAHWVAERQSAPSILHFGSDAQRDRFLPGIAAGELFFSIGMSEPEAGSDLASVRTSALQVDGGWSVTGRKIWTTHAHHNHFFAVLCRTAPAADGDKHSGLSQLIVDLSAPGVSVHPIKLLNNSHDFNEVVLDDVFVPDEMVLGTLGSGWHQVTSELVLERGGPDRLLSTFPLLVHYLKERPAGRDAVHETVGRLVARLAAIRQIYLSVAAMVDLGTAAPVAAAVGKDLGTLYEQEIVSALTELDELDPDPNAVSTYEQLLAEAIVMAPSFTIRGGTTEVLRIVTARALRSA
jgi:alkylation response protein AidB-like acyl-CoA dehydrogenase